MPVPLDIEVWVRGGIRPGYRDLGNINMKVTRGKEQRMGNRTAPILKKYESKAHL